MRFAPVLALAALLLAGCGEPCPPPGSSPPAGAAAAVPPPLPPGASGVEVAQAVSLEKRAPEEWDDLHNVFHLSDDVISGGEPHGEAALERIAAMGVKTIVSVDGKAPDVETAAKHGLRYVHVPIQYSGISAEERLRLAKTFRELDGPFYVHCFHGKHRGPAAAALGRIVRDGATREQALAEMGQWCGTSPKYAGLFETIARGAIPPAEQTATYPYDFPGTVRLAGFRDAMIAISRAWDNLELTARGDFLPDPAHPDLHAGNESVKLADAFAAGAAAPDVADRPEDFRTWMTESADHAARLREAVGALAEGPQPLSEAKVHLEALKTRCDACHKVYRNK